MNLDNNELQEDGLQEEITCAMVGALAVFVVVWGVIIVFLSLAIGGGA